MKTKVRYLFRAVTIGALGLVCVGTRSQGEPAQHDSSRWESAILKFERQDAKQSPPKQANLFVGSSSIRRWNLSESFPEFTVINRGFGGSQYADATKFADRIVVPHNPRVVVFFSGTNDLASGKSVAQAHQDFQAFVTKIKQSLPEAMLVCIGVKPSPRRWTLADKEQALNQLMKADCQADEKIVYLDVWSKMLDDDGQPQADLFVKDNLHMNDKGYKIWADLVRPHLTPDQKNASD